MCEYCESQKVIHVEDVDGVCKLENFVESDKTFCVNAYGHCHYSTEEICYSFKINYCPMCGKRLNTVLSGEMKEEIKSEIKECRAKLKSWKVTDNYQAINYYEHRILDLYEKLEEENE